jgi:hypothetical protein
MRTNTSLTALVLGRASVSPDRFTVGASSRFVILRVLVS